jgi:hypothetical protein
MKSNLNKEQKALQQLAAICNDLDRWPESWAGDKDDIPVGRTLLGLFKPYLTELINKGRTKATTKRHADYLWALGGEIIRDVSENETPFDVPGNELVLRYVDSDGGPLWQHASSDNDLQQFDSVCRQLYKFVTKMTL